MVTATLDKFGRIVIPRDIRQRHGWRPGTELVLRDSPRGLELADSADAEAAPSGWAWRDGMLVCISAATSDIGDISAFREALDTERDRDLGGLR
jgi:AbrB family looped-hinge helix DNA binding protein